MGLKLLGLLVILLLGFGCGGTRTETRVATATPHPVMLTATVLARQVAQTQTVEALPESPTPLPSNTRTPRPTRTAQATRAQTQVPTSGGNAGPVGVCTTGCSVSTPPAGCLIKGNVNSRGEKIYHTPGQQAYSRTEIRPAEGDAWFCSSAEAEANGFRHAQQ